MIMSNMFVHFLSNIVICCMLHNMILNEKDVEIDEPMQQLVVDYLPKGSRYGEVRRDDEQGTLRDQVTDNEIILLGEKNSRFDQRIALEHY